LIINILGNRFAEKEAYELCVNNCIYLYLQGYLKGYFNLAFIYMQL